MAFGNVNELLGVAASTTPVAEELWSADCNTWIKNGYVSGSLIRRVTKLCKNSGLSSTDALTLCLTYNIYDVPGLTDEAITTSLAMGFNETINRMNMRRGIDSLETEFRLLSMLIGFNEMCNVSNAMGCGVQIAGSVHTHDGIIDFHVETGIEKLWTAQQQDLWKQRNMQGGYM